ncbi:MAG: hypothetical protein ACFE0O_00885 [Opitutales bacterium]
MSSRYPLGRIHPHGSGGKSVYQRAAQEIRNGSGSSDPESPFENLRIMQAGLLYWGLFFPPLLIIFVILILVELFWDS